MGTKNDQNQQNDDDKQDEGGGAEEKLTRAEVQKMIEQGVNGAMKSWGPRLTKGLATADDLGAIKTALEGLKPAAPPAKGENQQNQVDPEVAKLKEQLDKLTKENERVKADREAQSLKIDSEQRERVMTDALRAKGVRGELVDAAAALLLVKRNVLKRTDDGKLVYVVSRKGYEDELSVEDGVEEFLKTAEGKSFLPPRDVGGSGEKGQGGKIPTGKGGVNLSLNDALTLALSGPAPGTVEE